MGPVATDSVATDVQYFEYTDDKSSKFWEVRVSGTTVQVRYGKIGTDGQTRNKDFPDAAKAQAHADKQIAKKTASGYEEV